MNKADELKRSFEEKTFDLFGELMIERETQELLEEIEADKANGNTAEMDAFFERYDKQNLERINSFFRRQKMRKFFSKTLPKIGQIAAIFIAVIALAGGVAVATSHTVRVRVMELLVNIEEEYTELSLHENPEASFDIPADWQGENYPFYIPDGMELFKVHSFVGESHVEYTDKDDPTLRCNFAELSESVTSNVDTENAEISPTLIRGNAGVVIKKGTTIMIYWNNERHYFVINAENIEIETVLQIARSVIRVD